MLFNLNLMHQQNGEYLLRIELLQSKRANNMLLFLLGEEQKKREQNRRIKEKRDDRMERKRVRENGKDSNNYRI